MASARTYDQLAYSVLGGAVATVTFSSISGSYTDLQLVVSSTNATAPTFLGIYFNGDTATNYSYRYLKGDRTSVTGGSTQTSASLVLAQSTESTTTPSLMVVDVFQYANTTPYKTVIAQHASDQSASGGVTVSCGLWRNTAAITSITIRNNNSYNFNVGSTFALYGIKSA